MTNTPGELFIGWAQTDITPTKPVLLRGQFHARVSEGVRDPITATVLTLETKENGLRQDTAIMVSCDVVAISNALRDEVRRRVAHRTSEIDPTKILLNATHTHTAPELDASMSDTPMGSFHLDLGAMDPAEYVSFAAERIADAILQAWQQRAPGGISFGLGRAVVGRNRRWSSFDGLSTMYGNTDDPNFSHIEGYEDHALHVLCTWSADRKLTGMIVNLACPSQVSEHEFQVSADFWHETRQRLRERFSDSLFVLPQCAPAGDQSPHPIFRKPAEERMLRLRGITRRDEIAGEITSGVDTIMPALREHIEWQVPLAHLVEEVPLTRRPLTHEDVETAMAEAQTWRRKYEELLRDLEANPSKKEQPRWYVPVTQAVRRAQHNERVATRFEEQQKNPTYPVAVHVIRLGDVAFATNPFEYYLDYGIQIQARSRATQAFLVQLAGPGTYLPTARSMAQGAYGAAPSSTIVGSEGGLELAHRSIELINSLWASEERQAAG